MLKCAIKNYYIETTPMQNIQIYKNPLKAFLIEEAVKRGEGQLAANGALTVKTGYRTGRSPKDRYIVKDDITHDAVDWGVINQPFSPEKFERLYEKALAFLQNHDHFISDVQAGADPHYAINIEMITETAWQHLFGRNLFILRDPNQEKTQHRPHWQLINLPSLTLNPEIDGTNSDGCVILNFSRRVVLILGMRYAGEMKKSIFSVMNFILPAENVLPMHCGANVGEKGDVALFFGLSGTGKTTLSADPERYLLGDDEHGWSPQGVFNIEGGCYAKCIDLSAEKEPIIWNAIKFGSIMENVVLNSHTAEPDYKDSSLTQNTRAAYPLDFIEKRTEKNQAGQPTAVLFLTCDLYGVLPPVAKLDDYQAVYYFLSGYTALVGSTEMGQGTGIKVTFSTCFGAPFFSRPAQVYADLLLEKIKKNQTPVYLVNTGWSGGGYGTGGQRFSIATTRSIVSAIIENKLLNASYDTLPGFNLKIPTRLEGIPSELLDPRKTWSSLQAYEKNAQELIQKFQENFKRFKVSDEILAGGPVLLSDSL